MVEKRTALEWYFEMCLLVLSCEDFGISPGLGQNDLTDSNEISYEQSQTWYPRVGLGMEQNF